MLDRPLDFDAAQDILAPAIRRAAEQQLDVGSLLACADQLKLLGRKQEIVDLYKSWVAFNSENPMRFAVYFNFGISLSEVGDTAGAINALREAIRVKPDFYPPYINLGSAFETLGQFTTAVSQWLQLVNALPTVTGDAVNYKTMALKQLGRVLESTRNDVMAEDALRQSLDINCEQADVVQHWIALRQRQCKWPLLTEWSQVTTPKLLAGISPLSTACFSDDPMFQLAKAYQYNKTSIGIPKQFRATRNDVTPATRKPGPLRIGYVSSDLREHAVGFAMTEVIELHDRARFEIFVYYCGVNSPDATQMRIKKAADHWLDLNGLDDTQAALRIRADAIDLLIDLNGYTKDARTKVFALQPAPINVNWFGFPNTMGTPYHHYIIADERIIPEEHEIYYSEKVVRLPCYQPNDRKRTVAPDLPTRASVGLPDGAFVYCCLNGAQKLTALTFQRWMVILQNVPDSVLWLLTSTDETDARLRATAQQMGVAPERLVFAGRRANPEHLARYPLADLFLDNLPYGAHTTAADSMWMGVPILTLPGRSFASRVCSSLAHAAGIGDLVCASADEYVMRAIEFGRDRTKLDVFKQRMLANRDTSLLFDSPALVRNLETAYVGMWADFERGARPQPDLRNLDIYHEIGLGLTHETMELLSADAYKALYAEKLSEWNDVFPIQPDARMWRSAL